MPSDATAVVAMMSPPETDRPNANGLKVRKVGTTYPADNYKVTMVVKNGHKIKNSGYRTRDTETE